MAVGPVIGQEVVGRGVRWSESLGSFIGSTLWLQVAVLNIWKIILLSTYLKITKTFLKCIKSSYFLNNYDFKTNEIVQNIVVRSVVTN
jgi:hypothetical protein